MCDCERGGTCVYEYKRNDYRILPENHYSYSLCARDDKQDGGVDECTDSRMETKREHTREDSSFRNNSQALAE